MPDRGESDLLVFREGQRELDGRALAAALARDLTVLAGASFGERSRKRALSALLRAGELECILTDLRLKDARRMASVTDAIASLLVGRSAKPSAELGCVLAGLVVPPLVKARPPEGFACDALHPLDYADLVDRLPLGADAACVIGLRSIGATLSAVVVAALARRGIAAARITARPEGHPYDRQVLFGNDDLRWIRRGIAVNADFLVVDEGPELSGSSFIAAGEALVAAGVPADRVTLLGSRAADPETLLARHGARRFRAFRSYAVAAATRLPLDIGVSLAGGAWRGALEPDRTRWPASWVTLERLKFLSTSGDRLFKFDGLGRYGAEVRRRADRLHREGFGLLSRDEGHGFFSAPWLPGRLTTAGDLGEEELHRLAAYCAFRAAAFPATAADAEEISAMVRHNAAAALGLHLGAAFELPLERPVIVDGRMMPHEWRRAKNGKLLKMDGVTHGDDHFFPGPTDIAWDLAGAIVEWQMDAGARRVFLDLYRRLSGDRPEARLPRYLLGYPLFHLASSRMAAHTLSDPAEAARAAAAARRYRAFLGAEVQAPSAVA